jgi:hypothetical protein
MMRKIKKLNIDSLIKEFELLDEKQNAGTLGGSYYYNENTGVFLGSTDTGNEVRFLNSSAWSYVKYHEISDAGVLFTDTSVNIYAKDALIRSFLPADAQDVYMSYLPGNSNYVAQFRYDSGNLMFAYNLLSGYFNDYNNLQSIMSHESYHWNNGHVPGSPNFSGYTDADEVETIMAQINDPSYQGTTNDFKERTAEYLYNKWGSLQDTFGHTLNDAYRIAGINGYGDGYGDDYIYEYEFGGYEY